LKEAFARRCEELKADNVVLTDKAAEYKQKLIQAEASILISSRKIDPKARPIKVDSKEDGNSNNYYQELVDKLLR
jgi:hypothetical protein